MSTPPDDDLFEPVRRAFRRTVTVQGDPDDVLALLTPEGERRWVPGWEPEYLPADAGEGTVPDEPPPLERGVVFRTRHGGETTLWSVGAVDREGRCFVYHRFTPGSRAAVVTVACAGPPGGPTEVDVTYDVTALTPEGLAVVEAMEDGFAADMDGWAPAMESLLGA